jgi:hypothetical protein
VGGRIGSRGRKLVGQSRRECLRCGCFSCSYACESAPCMRACHRCDDRRFRSHDGGRVLRVFVALRPEEMRQFGRIVDRHGVDIQTRPIRAGLSGLPEERERERETRNERSSASAIASRACDPLLRVATDFIGSQCKRFIFVAYTTATHKRTRAIPRQQRVRLAPLVYRALASVLRCDGMRFEPPS